MKHIKDIREDYNLVTEKEQSDISKLTALVRAGLFDVKKINIVKRALEKNPAEMTLAERKILIELLESLMSEVLSSQQVYSKVKQNVMSSKDKMNEATKDSYLTKFDPRMTKYPSESDIPAVLILKRKAIRIYPDNQKVALYYAQAIDKYVSIPYGNISTAINEDNIEEKFQDVPITTYSVKQQEKANKIVDKVGKDKVNSAGIKVGMALRRKIGPPIEKAAKAANDYVGKKVDQLTKKPKISLGNLKKGFKADRSDKPYLSNPRSYDNKFSSPSASPMHKIGKAVSGVGKKTGMFETFAEKLEEKRQLKELSKKEALSAADDVADVAVPFYSAGKKALSGDYKGAAIDAGIDAVSAVAAPFTGGASLAARTAAKTAAKVSEKAFVKGPKVKPKNEPEVPTTKPTEVKPKNEPEVPTTKPADKPKKAEPDKTPDTEPQTVPATKPESKPDTKTKTDDKPKTDTIPDAKPSLAKRIAAGAAGAGAVGLAAALGGAGESNSEKEKKEKKYTEPRGQFKLGAKISSADKFDTEVARNRKRESQYDKSLVSEDVISQLNIIKEGRSEGTINIGNDSIDINKTIAKKIITVFESLNKENQKKINVMLNESVDSFKKIINFAVRQ